MSLSFYYSLIQNIFILPQQFFLAVCCFFCIAQSHTCDNIIELPNYWDGLVYLHLAETPGRTLKDCSAQEIEDLSYQCELLLARKLRIAALEAQGYGLDVLSLDVSQSRATGQAAQGDPRNEAGGVIIDGDDSDSVDSDIPELGGDDE